MLNSPLILACPPPSIDNPHQKQISNNNNPSTTSSNLSPLSNLLNLHSSSELVPSNSAIPNISTSLTSASSYSSSSSRSSALFSSPITTTQSWPEPSPQPSQQLIITLVGAKDLNLPHDSLSHVQKLRPYAVLQFDHTESITNEAGPPSSASALQKPGPRWRSVRPHHRATEKSSPSGPSNHRSTSRSPSRLFHLTQTHPSDLEHPVWNHVAIFDIFKPRSSLFISVYHHHNSNPDLPTQEKTDEFLGGAIVDLRTLLKTKSFDATRLPTTDPPLTGSTNPPALSNYHSTTAADIHGRPFDSGIRESNSSLKTVILDDSIDLWNHSGEIKTGSILIKIEIDASNDTPNDGKNEESSLHHETKSWVKKKKISMDDFEIIKLIGEGSYGQVFRVRKKDTRRLYAMKTLEKSKISISKQDRTTEESNTTDHNNDNKIKLERVLTERKILEKTRGCEFLVGLKFSFQTKENLNLIMDLKSGGELMSYMQRFGGRFDESWVVFYTAEILSGLKFLHSMHIAYRDLKPENCLLDATGHVALCDFGLSKLDMKPDSITNTFCGTTEYIAPEVLLEQGYTRLVDFWSLGVLIFEMSVGWTPFFSENRVARYSLILESDITTKFPKRGISDVTKNIILHLLQREPSRRLGSNGIHEIETHNFFSKLDWKALVRKRITPPFKPRVASDMSLSYSSDPNYSYGGRSSNSVVIERQTNQVLTNPTSAFNIDGGRSKNNLTTGFISSSHFYSQQHSRRSSVEKQSTSNFTLSQTNSSAFNDHDSKLHHHLENRSPPSLFTAAFDRESYRSSDHNRTHFRNFTFSRDTD